MNTKIFTLHGFQGSFNGAHFLLFKVDKIFVRFPLEHKELRSVKIGRLHCTVLRMVQEILAFTFYIFAVCDNSVMTYII